MSVTSQLLRCLPRAKLLACSLPPCQQHQVLLDPLAHHSASCGWLLPARSYHASPPRHSYILTPPQVNSILKANEYSFKVPTLFCAQNISFPSLSFRSLSLALSLTPSFSLSHSLSLSL